VAVKSTLCNILARFNDICLTEILAFAASYDLAQSVMLLVMGSLIYLLTDSVLEPETPFNSAVASFGSCTLI